MAIKPVPETEDNGKVKGNVAQQKKDYDGLSKPQVEVWEAALQKSRSVRDQEQIDIVADSGGPDAHEEKLDNDPIYKKKWDDHVERINNEETAFRLAGEWITDYDKKNP